MDRTRVLLLDDDDDSLTNGSVACVDDLLDTGGDNKDFEDFDREKGMGDDMDDLGVLGVLVE